MKSIRKRSAEPLHSLRNRAAKTLTPLWMHLDLTYRCNLGCTHCYLKHGRAAGELSTIEWRRVLDELAGMGTLFVTFSGGEVLLRKDFFELARHALDLRFVLAVFTNGTLIDARTAARLAAFPLRQVGISVYSMDPRVHDSMTGVPGSLVKTKRAVELLAAAGVNVVVKTLITGLNFERYCEIEKWADSLGPKVMHQLDLLVTPRHDKVRREAELNLDDAHRLAFLRARSASPDASERAEGMEREPPPRRPGAPPCYAGKAGGYIGPYGDVYPCIEWHQECGNVGKRRFRDIWLESSGMRFARGFVIGDMKECLGCAMLGYCTLCPGLNMQETGVPSTPSKLVCMRTRAMFSMQEGD